MARFGRAGIVAGVFAVIGVLGFMQASAEVASARSQVETCSANGGWFCGFNMIGAGLVGSMIGYGAFAIAGLVLLVAWLRGALARRGPATAAAGSPVPPAPPAAPARAPSPEEAALDAEIARVDAEIARLRRSAP